MMDTLLQFIPFWVIVLLALIVAGIAVSALLAFFAFLFKLGVVLHEARKPPHLDAGDYRLAQGREVRPEVDQRQKRQDAKQ
jgi:hypothetical protein